MTWTWIRQYITRNPVMIIIGIFIVLFALRLKTQPSPQKPPLPSLPKVVVQKMTAQPVITSLAVSGHTTEARRVILKAKTSGRILSLSATKGQRVDGGQGLILIDADDRPARLEQAKSKFRHRELEYKAGVKLEAKAFKAENELAGNKAELDAAKSLLATIEQEISDTHLKAPFGGILEGITVEVGDVVGVGDPVATVIDLDPLKVICHISEKDISRLEKGGEGGVTLSSFQEKQMIAKVTYIAKSADPKTRTYRVELEMDNPDMTIPAGLTARIAFPTGHASGYLVSPAVMSLRDDGVIGVKTVEEGKVAFHPAQIIETKREGLWITGFANSITLITSGGDFVVEGQEVEGVAGPVSLGQKTP